MHVVWVCARAVAQGAHRILTPAKLDVDTPERNARDILLAIQAGSFKPGAAGDGANADAAPEDTQPPPNSKQYGGALLIE